MSMSKKVSIIMGIYNCENTLEEAVYSIINQTYTNWELIMCDDGSTDGTLRIAKKLSNKDSRIIIINNQNNVGLNKTLNKCLSVASGYYIARMDGDDISVPTRLMEEVEFLESNKKYDIVSSNMVLFDEYGDWGVTKNKEYPTKEDVVCGSPICHAPVMMKKACYDVVGGYTEDKHMLRVEDVNLWIKLYLKGYKCYNIQKPLYKMRNDKNALNRRKFKYRINSTYVRLQGCYQMKLSLVCYIKCFMPILIGLVPAKLRFWIKRVLEK